MTINMDEIKEYLEKHLLNKIESHFKTSRQEGNDNLNLFNKNDNDESVKKQTETYQYRIWRIKDRLSYGFFGPDSESLADDFIKNFGIQVEKGSFEYYEILKEVLNTEIKYNTFLLQHAGVKNGFLSEYYQKLLDRAKKETD